MAGNVPRWGLPGAATGGLRDECYRERVTRTQHKERRFAVRLGGEKKNLILNRNTEFLIEHPLVPLSEPVRK